MVVLDLWHCHLEDPTKYLGISLNRNSFGTAKRYDELHIDYAPFMDVIRNLRHCGYLDFVKGFKDRNSGKGFQTRIRATEKLVALLKETPKLSAASMERSQDMELVVLRDDKKNDIDYDDTEKTNAMRAVLSSYNKLLSNTYLDIQLKDYPAEVDIDLSDKTVKRVFNNGSFDQGGRFYGGWWQGLPKELRRRILIRDKPTLEVDFSGLHIVMLYALKGIDYFADIGGDPYQLDGYDYTGVQGEKYRDFFKLILLCALNAKDRGEAAKAVQYDLNQDRTSQFPKDLKVSDALARFEAKHKAIADHFYRQDALALQNLDSQVAERIIVRMMEKEYPVLCVHDSFICMRSDIEYLTDLLEDELNTMLTKRGGSKVKGRVKIAKDFFAEKAEKFREGRGFVDTSIKRIVETADLEQNDRYAQWGRDRVQYPIQYRPPGLDLVVTREEALSLDEAIRRANIQAEIEWEEVYRTPIDELKKRDG